jgi:hypothetical protein
LTILSKFYYNNKYIFETDIGYRFIWRYPNGKLQPARGQARIPSKNELEVLTSKATQVGWYK